MPAQALLDEGQKEGPRACSHLSDSMSHTDYYTIRLILIFFGGFVWVSFLPKFVGARSHRHTKADGGKLRSERERDTGAEKGRSPFVRVKLER